MGRDGSSSDDDSSRSPVPRSPLARQRDDDDDDRISPPPRRDREELREDDRDEYEREEDRRERGRGHERDRRGRKSRSRERDRRDRDGRRRRDAYDNVDEDDEQYGRGRDYDKHYHKSRRDREKDRDRGRDTERYYRRRSRSRDRRRSRSRDRRDSHYRKRSRSRSRARYRRSSSTEYGGYIPRKRQDGGQQPPGSGPYSSNDPYRFFRKQNIPKDPEEMKRMWEEQQLRSRQLVLQQQAASAAAAASKTQREVYVGNLQAGTVTDAALRELFNTHLTQTMPEKLPMGQGAVVNVSLHSEGRYAFVEFRTPEMATSALQLSGQLSVLGNAVSIGRPSGYIDPVKAQQQAQAAAAELAKFTANRTPGGGENGDGEGKSGKVRDEASQRDLNAAVMATVSAQLLERSMQVTQYLSIVGMITNESLAEGGDYDGIVEDLVSECKKFGRITAIKVPRPSPPPLTPQPLLGTGDYGKCFVAFQDEHGATQARNAIHGRMFDGVGLHVTYVTQEKFVTLPQQPTQVDLDLS